MDGNPTNPSSEGKTVVYVEMNDMSALRDALLGAGHKVDTSLTNLPKDGFIGLSDEDFENNMKAIDAFLALDDVDSVEHNIDMTDDGSD